MFQNVVVGLCFFVATYENEVIFVGDHKKNADLWNCSGLSKHCTKPVSDDEMCPRWASFSNFNLGG